MLITVALSVEEYTQLDKLARHYANMDAGTLLRCFTGDLVHSAYTGGSDERMYANQWFDRRFPDWQGERMPLEPIRPKAPLPSARPLAEIPDYFDKLVADKKGDAS